LSSPTFFYIVDWLPPDFGAVGQYAVQYGEKLALEGRKVHLIGLSSKGSSREERRFEGGGVLVTTRLGARPTNKSHYLSRLAWSAVTNLRLVLAASKEQDCRGAEVMFTGSPAFMLFFAIWLKPLRRVKLVYRITDFYPEVVAAALPQTPYWMRLFIALTWVLRRRIDAFEALGEDQRHLLLAGGVDPARVRVARDKSPVAVTPNGPRGNKPVELGQRRALLYSGNMGVAHEVKTVLRGFEQHHRQGRGAFALWLNATGDGANWLAAELAALGLPFARTPPVPLEDLAPLLLAADAHLVSLKPEFAGYVLPSKVYGCLASERPMIFVGPKRSDVHLLGSQAPRVDYTRVEPGDAMAFALALDRLS
jgi:hypothetical protein